MQKREHDADNVRRAGLLGGGHLRHSNAWRLSQDVRKTSTDNLKCGTEGKRVPVVKLQTKFHHSSLSGIVLIPTITLQGWALKYIHVTVSWWRWRLHIYRSGPWEDPKNPLSRFSHKPPLKP